MNIKLAVAGITISVLFAATGCTPGGTDPATSSESFDLLFTGDLSTGESYQEIERSEGRPDVLKARGYDAFFKGVDPLLQSADLVVANLETALTEIPISPLRGVKSYIHWAHPEKSTAAMARHGIDVVSLANNHAMDFGEEGLRNTLNALDKHKIARFGAGLNETEAAKPYVKMVKVGSRKIKIVVIAAFEQRKSYWTKYKAYASGEKSGVNPLDVGMIRLKIEEARKAGPGAFVVVYPHWGRNYGSRRGRETDAAKRFISAGADMVIGTGAHHLQAIRFRNGKPVLHNIGNFIFNSSGRYAQYRSPGISLVPRITLYEQGGRIRRRLRIYPVQSDNLRTNYQVRPVSSREFKAAFESLAGKSGSRADFAAKWNTGRDRVGRYLETRF